MKAKIRQRAEAPQEEPHGSFSPGRASVDATALTWSDHVGGATRVHVTRGNHHHHPADPSGKRSWF